MLASELFSWGGAVGEILDDDRDDKLTRLLDEDELLQEIKSHNEGLVIFLAEPSSLAHLVQLVTQPFEHEEGISDDEKTRRTMRWPYMACEVLCCDVGEIIDKLAAGSHEGEGHLAALLRIADTKQPVESRLAGYFEKVLGLLLRRKFVDVVSAVRDKGLDLFRALAKHLDNYSMMQVLLKLLVPQILTVSGAEPETETGSDEPCCRGVAWDAEPAVAKVLLDRLSEPPAAEHVSELLLCALRHCGAGSTLSANLLGRSSLESLVALAGSDSAQTSVQIGAVKVLEVLAQHCVEEDCFSAIPELSRSDGIHVEHRATMVAAVGKLIPKVAAQLDSETTATTLGSLKLGLVQLLETLFRLRSSEIDRAFLEGKILITVLRLFFAFPWNSLLHRSVTAMIVGVLEGGDARVTLQRQLIDDAAIQRQVLDAYTQNQTAEASPKGRRRGYMGHLHQVACAICKVSRDTAPVAAMLSASPDAGEWHRFVLTVLAAQTATQCRPLGGHDFPRREDERDLEQLQDDG